MRYNAFGDAYCSNLAELLNEIEDKAGYDLSEIHLTRIEGPEGDITKWHGEIAENESGVTVCYIEADSREAVKEIAKEAGIEDNS